MGCGHLPLEAVPILSPRPTHAQFLLSERLPQQAAGCASDMEDCDGASLRQAALGNGTCGSALLGCPAWRAPAHLERQGLSRRTWTESESSRFTPPVAFSVVELAVSEPPSSSNRRTRCFNDCLIGCGCSANECLSSCSVPAAKLRPK